MKVKMILNFYFFNDSMLNINLKGNSKLYKIFIVEDDFGIATGIKKQLETWEFEVICVENFKNILSEFSNCNPHLVLMDISLPFYNGYYWCEEIRKISKVPIIFISSASENMNIIMAMNMGADDFIAKPFDVNVLLAKIKALLRRSYDFSQTMPILEHRNAFLNTGDNTFIYENENIELTKNEYKILLLLMKNKGKVVTRETLMERLWESESFVDENTLTVNVNRLRKKLDNVGLDKFITTKFGVGYIIM